MSTLEFPGKVTVTAPVAGGVYNFTFDHAGQEELYVTLVDADGAVTELDLNIGYTVSPTGFTAGGGTVTLLAEPAAGDVLVIDRSTRALQEASLKAAEKPIERALDRLAQVTQDLARRLSFTVSATAAAVLLTPLLGAVLTLPGATQIAAGMMSAADKLKLDGLANTLVSLDTPFLASQAQLAATEIDPDLGHVWCAGRTSADDNGGGVFVRRVGEPAHPGKVQSADGAWWELVERAPRPSQFGAAVDAATNDAAALADAIAYCEATGARAVHLDVGIMALATPVAVPAQLGIIGIDDGGQTGSARRSCTLRWTGTGGYMFTSAATRNLFAHFGVENTGTGVAWLQANAGAQRHTYKDLTFLVPSDGGCKRWSGRVIEVTTNALGYSTFEDIVAKEPAPVFMYIDGNASPNGITPISFVGHNLFHNAGANSFTVVKVTDEALDGLYFSPGTTVNQLGAGETTLVDTTASALAKTIGNLIIDGGEFDDVGNGAATDRFLKLKNVANAQLTNLNIQGGGVRDYFADLDGTHVSACHGNYASSITEYVFDVDAASTIADGDNEIEWASVKGLYDPAVATAGMAFPTYGPAVRLQGNDLRGRAHGIFVLEVTDANAFQLQMDITKPGWMRPGQVFTVIIKNMTAGAIANPTFATALRTTGAFTSPAAGMNRSVTFVSHGTFATEEYRRASDLAN